MPKTNSVPIIVIMAIITLIAGCASKAVSEKAESPVIRTEKIFSNIPSPETTLIRSALSRLNNNAGTGDYIAAKTSLESFIEKYPQDQWASCAQNLIQTIDTILMLRNKVKQEQQFQEKFNSEKLKLLKENETLKMEAVKHLQENEQLRSDIARLRQLEIQMEKREKMLK